MGDTQENQQQQPEGPDRPPEDRKWHYHHCPRGCQLRQAGPRDDPFGYAYGCLGKEETGPDSDAHFLPYCAAWVCPAAFFKHRRWRKAGWKPPPVNPKMVQHTKVFRASLRPWRWGRAA